MLYARCQFGHFADRDFAGFYCGGAGDFGQIVCFAPRIAAGFSDPATDVAAHIGQFASRFLDFVQALAADFGSFRGVINREFSGYSCQARSAFAEAAR